MKSIKKIFIFLLFFQSFLIFANEQPNYSSDHILVLADPLELNSLHQIVDHQEIEMNQDRLSIQDEFKFIPSVQHFQSGGFGKQSSFFLRGGNRGDQAFFIEGVQLQDPLDIDRSVDIGTFGFDLFDKIDVYKGSQSHLGGSNILTGSLNFSSSKTTPNQIALNLGSKNTKKLRGSFQTHNTQIKISHLTSNNISSANELKTEHAESDPHQRTSAFLKHHEKITNQLRFKIFSYINQSVNDIDSTNFSTNLPVDKIRDDQSSSKYHLLSTQLAYQNKKKNLNSDIFYNFSTSERDSSGNRYKGKTKEFINKNTLLLSPHQVLTVTLEAQREQAEQGSSINGRELHLFSTAFDYYLKYHQLNFQLGVQGQKYSSFRGYHPYHSGIAYHFSKQGHIQITHSRSYKFPSLYQLYAPASSGSPIGNVFLAAEEKRGNEIKVQFLNSSVSFFHHEFKNLIDYDSDQGYLNLDKARIKGIEFSNEIDFLNHFKYQNASTLMSAIDQTTGAYLARRSRIKITNQLFYQFGSLSSVQLSHIYQGDRNDNGRLPSYQIFDLGFNHVLSQKTNISLYLHNLFDREYEQIRGYGTFGRYFQLGITRTL